MPSPLSQSQIAAKSKALSGRCEPSELETSCQVLVQLPRVPFDFLDRPTIPPYATIVTVEAEKHIADANESEEIGTNPQALKDNQSLQCFWSLLFNGPPSTFE